MGKQELFTVNHVTNLVRAINHFRPILVNEKWTGKYEWDASAPNLHQLVNIVFGAIGAMKQFIEERDTMERNHTNLLAEVMLCIAEFQNEHIKSDSLIQGVQTLIGQKHQCFDVLDKIYSICQNPAIGDLESIDKINDIIEKFKTPRATGTVNETSSKTEDKTNGIRSLGSFDECMGPRTPNA